MTRPLFRSLYVQVLAGIILGVIVGFVWPEKGAAMKPLGDGFIKLIDLYDDGGRVRGAGERPATVDGGAAIDARDPASDVEGSRGCHRQRFHHARRLACRNTVDPPAGLALLVGVDRFMSEARAITNLIGNAVAAVVIARWDGALDLAHARRMLAGNPQEHVAPVHETAAAP